MITKEEVKHIAKLARLGLTEEEIEKFQKELSSILDYFEKLKEIDVSDVAPESPSGVALRASRAILVENVARDDKISPRPGGEKLLNLAPDKKEGFLKVKSVF